MKVQMKFRKKMMTKSPLSHFNNNKKKRLATNKNQGEGGKIVEKKKN